MPERPVERISKYNLTGATEDTYSSQVAQNPTTARRVQSLFPSLAGYLEREAPNATIGQQLPSGVIWLFEYDQNNQGSIIRFYFCATQSTLYLLTGPINAGTWTPQTPVGVLAGPPQACVIQNLMHFSDGKFSYTFDGVQWTTDGLPIPQHAPSLSVQSFTASIALTTVSRANGIVTISTATPFVRSSIGSSITLVGVADPTFNQEFQVATIITSTTFTFLQPGFPDSTSSGGTANLTSFSIQTNRYYWTSFADFYPTHPHESSSSPRSVGVGPITNQQVVVAQRAGTIAAVGGSTSVVGVGTDFDQSDVGQVLYLNGQYTTQLSPPAGPTNIVLALTIAGGASGGTTAYVGTQLQLLGPGAVVIISGFSNPQNNGTFTVISSTPANIVVNNPNGTFESLITNNIPEVTNQGSATITSTGQMGFVIQSVQDAQHMIVSPALVNNASALPFVIAPPRATHWNIYCSETENSNVGFLLAQVQIFIAPTPFTSSGPQVQTTYLDQQPFSNVPGSTINLTLQRPIRNDPTTGSHIMTVHKRRIFRRNEKLPNFFNYTAAEEVKSTNVGTPEECVPGHSPVTISDLVNEQSYPDQSHTITAMVDHADALFIGSEKNTIPLFGETLDDFALSQINAFAVGMGSPYAALSMPHGLGFLSYDRKVYLWPQQWIPFYAPEETTTLIELSKPLRLKFQNINPAAMNQTWFAFLNYGQRNWLAVAFQLTDLSWHTYVFDFETKGWFELQRGVQSLAVFEVSAGVKTLIGGGTDGNVYVMNDPSGFFSTFGLNLPSCLFRPSLIDFGAPDTKHMLLYLELEVSNAAMMNDITVNFYLDPLVADTPGTPISLTMQQVRGANRFRGFFQGGSVCERVLIELNVASSLNNGVVRSLTLASKSVSKLIR